MADAIDTPFTPLKRRACGFLLIHQSVQPVKVFANYLVLRAEAAFDTDICYGKYQRIPDACREPAKNAAETVEIRFCVLISSVQLVYRHVTRAVGDCAVIVKIPVFSDEPVLRP